MCQVAHKTSREEGAAECSKPLLIAENNLYYLIIALNFLKHTFICTS
jgi:hypothetical protein